MDQPLNGLYKIHIDDVNYFITKYKNGIEDNNIFNYKISYRNGKLKELDVISPTLDTLKSRVFV